MSEKAEDNIGPHLLGRVAPPPDPRDWSLEEIQAKTETAADPLDALLAKVIASSSVAKPTKNLFKELVKRVKANPNPAPTPTPTGAVLWADPDQLDQGQTPHCVGFGHAQFCNASPINDHLTDADGHAIYYECKIIDGEPRAEDGSSVHSGMKALANRGRVKAYAWASTTDAISDWILKNGPVVVGTDWYNDMFDPDPASGLVTPTGGIAGGHCYLAIGFDPTNKIYTFQNSWGTWGLNGRFKMRVADFGKLIVSGFEAAVALEVAL